MDRTRLNTLLLQVREGDEQSFATLYEETYKGVFSFIYSYVQNYHTAEDLSQDTFIKVKTNADKYRTNDNAAAWILQIAKNTALDYLRKRNRDNSCELNENLSDAREEGTGEMYMHDLLNRSVSGDERQILLLHLLYGYKNREIAEIMGLPLGTVLWKYNRAIKTLKTKLKEEA